MSALSGPDRWAALESAWVDAACASDAHPLGSVPWQSLGACGARQDLPWTAEPDQVGPWDAESMRVLCRSCPVLAECTTYAARAKVCAGWWAGSHRDPAYVEPARPGWVPVGDDTAQGTLPLRIGPAA